jgi:hypothetical protein
MGYDSGDRIARRFVVVLGGLLVGAGCSGGVEIADHEVSAAMRGTVLDDALGGVWWAPP